MKTFDEKYNAWLEGHMTVAEAAAFERELEERPLSAEQLASLEADSDGLEELFAKSMGDTAVVAPKMGNEEFFNHQLLERIAEEEALETNTVGEKSQAAVAQGSKASWQERISGVLGFLALRPIATSVSAIAILLVTGLGVLKPWQSTPQASQYYVVFENVSVQKPDQIWAGSVNKAGATVLWVEGLDWIDGNEALISEAGA